MAVRRDQPTRTLRLAGMLGAVLACCVMVSGCQSSTGEGEAGQGEGLSQKKGQGLAGELESGGIDLGFLMTMSWGQAKALAVMTEELPPFFRVAADSIEVAKRAPDGRPLVIRAKGNVFIEMLFKDVGRVLCREAYISEEEVIMRGRPLLQRGGSVVEGVDDATVFFMIGPKLRVIGRHRLNNELQKMAAAGATNAGRASEGFTPLPGVMPTLPTAGPWAGGPNPLLPPLSPSTVSDTVRQQMRSEAESVMVMPLEVPGGEPESPPTGPASPTSVPPVELREPES